MNPLGETQKPGFWMLPRPTGFAPQATSVVRLSRPIALRIQEALTTVEVEVLRSQRPTLKRSG